MDGTSKAERLLDCSLRIFNKKDNIYQGAFVEGISSSNLHDAFDSTEFINNQYTRSEILERILHTNIENSSEFIERFVGKCDDLELKTKVYLTPEDIDLNLVNQSLYNDLFLIGKDIFNKENIDKFSFANIKAMLRNTKCPILLLSCEQQTFKNIVMLYDGSKRSFEAIKLFMYLMNDQVQENNLFLNVVVTNDSSKHERSVIEYLKNYKLHFSTHRVYPENYYKELLILLSGLDNFLLVTGVNRDEIIDDMLLNKQNSFFMNPKRSIFLG
jgi:hypothetical protein